MKRLLLYLFVVFSLGLTFSVNSNGKEINKEFYKFKKILVPLAKDGSWKLIGKKIQNVYSGKLTWILLAQTKDNQLSKLIELVHISSGQDKFQSIARSETWLKDFVYQKNGYKSCIPQKKNAQQLSLREEYYVYEVSEKSNGCFFTRNMDIEKEVLQPTIKRKTDNIDTNHFSAIVKKYINDYLKVKFPRIMLRSDHYFSSKTEVYGYFEMINPDINGAPNTLFKSEKKSEYYPLNINNYPQKKNFYLTLIKNQAKKHSKFETELKRKNKIDLAKYINYEPIIYLNKNSENKQTAKNESETILKKLTQAEPTEKPKSKVKVVKKEPKQEEIKPGNKDNEAPVIEIAEAITVNDTIYEIEGKVIDKSEKLFVQIDGETIAVKKGKFKVKRYSPVDEQIKIVAIDQWGNKSKTKLVNITIDIDETIDANKLEPLNPSNISNKSSDNKVALIIGIENYTEAPKANYANLDAKYFFDYARRAFGVNKQNINLLINEEATVVKTDRAVSLWLKSKIKKNKSDLIIFLQVMV